MAEQLINKVKVIITEYPVSEIWKFLRFFNDEKFTCKKICIIHNLEWSKLKESKKSNIKKQARQIRYCIQQAEEYFNASSQVGLPTRPNLLYYGAVSLSKALILLKNDGTFSFDKQRKKQNNHNHHGLEKKFNVIRNSDLETFLKDLSCNIFLKKDKSSNNSEPWGHFPIFYKSLVPCPICIIKKIAYSARGVQEKNHFTFNCSKKSEINKLIHLI